jgi:uncharacterized RDD family membrane protein YckC
MSSFRLKYSTFWPRLIAGFIDGLLLTPIAWIEKLVTSSDPSTQVAVEWAIISHSAYWVYSVLMHGYYGQTVGKMAAGIKVVDITETPISLRQAFLRDSVYAGLSTIELILFLFQKFFSGNVELSIMGLLANLIGLASFGWFLGEFVTMLTNEKRRALHDLIAGTVVVRTEFIQELKISTQDQSDYVSLEVRGTLLHRSNCYYISTTDADAPTGEKLVRLERNQAKDHDLDRYLDSLEGKVVVISGVLDRRRVSREDGIIDLYLNSMSQVKLADR